MNSVVYAVLVIVSYVLIIPFFYYLHDQQKILKLVFVFSVPQELTKIFGVYLDFFLLYLL